MLTADSQVDALRQQGVEVIVAEAGSEYKEHGSLGRWGVDNWGINNAFQARRWPTPTLGRR